MRKIIDSKQNALIANYKYIEICNLSIKLCLCNTKQFMIKIIGYV